MIWLVSRSGALPPSAAAGRAVGSVGRRPFSRPSEALRLHRDLGGCGRSASQVIDVRRDPSDREAHRDEPPQFVEDIFHRVDGPPTQSGHKKPDHQSLRELRQPVAIDDLRQPGNPFGVRHLRCQTPPGPTALRPRLATPRTTSGAGSATSCGSGLPPPNDLAGPSANVLWRTDLSDPRLLNCQLQVNLTGSPPVKRTKRTRYLIPFSKAGN